MRIEFVKAVGSGNDFVIIDNLSGVLERPAELARKLCPRRLSVGADGLLLLEKGERVPFRMRIFNPDGSEAEMCGNGLRCFLRYLVYRGLLAENVFAGIETGAGLRRGRAAGNLVTASLGVPEEARFSFQVETESRSFNASFVNTGVPHLVVEVDRIESLPIQEWGSRLRFHPDFAPRGTNVDFVEIRDGLILIRTYERGVESETLSCGTGSAAAAFVLNRLNRIAWPARLRAASGEILQVSESDSELLLEGEVSLVYAGSLLA